MTRIAMESLGFKAEELRTYANNQWSLLVSNGLTERDEYREITKNAISSYASSLIRSDSEIIFAVNENKEIAFATAAVKLDTDEKLVLGNLKKNGREGWIEIDAGNQPRVGNGFVFDPFSWYVLVTEGESAFYREVTQIQQQSFIILGASLVISVALLLIFSGYITRPVRRVAQAMRDIISFNDMSRRVEVEYKDEIGELAHTFNIMITQLDRAYGQIKDFAFKAVVAKKNEHKVRNIFQKYVPKDVIDSLFMNPEHMLVGDNRVLAVLFSDIRNFTTLSEGFMPEDLVSALNQYFEIIVDIIMSHDGIVDKYIGDSVMAFFGAPVQHENDAAAALEAAFDMREAIDKFNEKQKKEGKPPFKTGMGINYGMVTVGNIGTEKKMDYTVIGDMVNLGNRLEGLTKIYKQDIIFSESVYRKVKDLYPCRMVDKVVVKGKTTGERIFTAARKLDEKHKKLWAYHHAGLKHYYRREFERAKKYFHAARRLDGVDTVSEIFFERADGLIRTPPPKKWDGQEVITEK